MGDGGGGEGDREQDTVGWGLSTKLNTASRQGATFRRRLPSVLPPCMTALHVLNEQSVGGPAAGQVYNISSLPGPCHAMTTEPPCDDCPHMANAPSQSSAELASVAEHAAE